MKLSPRAGIDGWMSDRASIYVPAVHFFALFAGLWSMEGQWTRTRDRGYILYTCEHETTIEIDRSVCLVMFDLI